MRTSDLLHLFSDQYKFDFVTVLTATRGRLVKQISPGAEPGTFHVSDYDAGPEFTSAPREIWCRAADGAVEQLACIFDRLRPNECVIHGQLRDGVDGQRPHRRAMTGDGATYEDAPHLWLVIDIDNVEVADDEWMLQLQRGALPLELQMVLPSELLDADCHYRLTSSAGIKKGKIHLRLTYWLDQTLTGPEKKRWLADRNGIDLSIYCAVQPVYMAAPTFVGGAEDPLKVKGINRAGMIQGKQRVVSVPAIVPERERPPYNGEGEVQASDEELEQWAAVLPNNDVSWKEWSNTLMAFHRASRGSAHEAVRRWSAKSQKHSDVEFDKKWEHLHKSPGHTLGANWLRARAREAVAAAAETAANGSGGAKAATEEDSRGGGKGADNSNSQGGATSGTTKRRFPLLHVCDIELNKKVRWLVRNLIPREGLVVVWGPPKCGKTFWTFDLVMHIALGRYYRGRPVEQASVVYVACEGEWGLAARVAAYRRQPQWLPDDRPDFYLVPTRLDLPGEYRMLIGDIVVQIPPDRAVGVIVIDTLNRSIHGSESKDEDMAAYIGAADALRGYFHCAVIIIHHCGIIESRPRGHTSLTGAADAQIAMKMETPANIITSKVEHLKDGPCGDEIISRLEEVTVGEDDNSDPITSCIVVPVDGAPRAAASAARKLSPNEQIALDTLRRALAAEGVAASPGMSLPGTMVVSMDVWRRFYLSGTSADGQSDNTRRKALRESCKRLLAQHIIAICNEMVCIP
jgi:hypothetical protein